MAKYIKENGLVRAIATTNLNLEKPLTSDNYSIEVHNRNMDKIDVAIQEANSKIDGLELVASNVMMTDGTTVEATVTANKTSILNLQKELGTNKSILEANINAIREVL